MSLFWLRRWMLPSFYHLALVIQLIMMRGISMLCCHHGAHLSRSGPLSILLPLLLAISAFSFALGLTLPLVAMDKLIFFTETPSLIGILDGLWNGEEPILAVLVGLFSLLLPSLKIVLLHVAAFRGKRSRSVSLLSLTSKWSMMDVLLVALVIFSAKTSGLATATALPGIWFYATATLTSALAAAMVKK